MTAEGGVKVTGKRKLGSFVLVAARQFLADRGPATGRLPGQLPTGGDVPRTFPSSCSGLTRAPTGRREIPDSVTEDDGSGWHELPAN